LHSFAELVLFIFVFDKKQIMSIDGSDLHGLFGWKMDYDD